MSTTSAAALPPTGDPALGPVHRLSVEQYEAMGRAGILSPDDRVELIEGWLVEKMTKNPPHRAATRKVRVLLESLVPDGWYVDTQEPVVTADSVPEPDVAVVRGNSQDYSERHPTAGEVGLVVEISDTSLERDRKKSRIYARAGVPAFWILNLVERKLELYTTPGESGYATRTDHPAEDEVSVVLIGVEAGRVRVSDLLP